MVNCSFIAKKMVKFQKMITLFSFVGAISLGCVLARPQAVTLRHPESNQNSAFGMPNARPEARPPGTSLSAPALATIPQQPPPSLPNRRARYSAKPGDVVVHFDRHHEIQRLQYVLQNGQLATLYQSRTATGRVPAIHVVQSPPKADGSSKRDDVITKASSSSTDQQQPGQSKQRQSQQQPFPGILKSLDYPAVIDPAETIEVLNSKLDSVSHIVGDHTTVSMPSEHQLISGDDATDKLDIFATVAADAIHNGAQMGEAKLHKAGLMFNKLKAKVSQKLHELPSLVDSQLRAKSSQGQVFFDAPHNKIVAMDDGDDNNDDGQPNPAQPSQPTPEVVKTQAAVSPAVKSLLDEVARQHQASDQ